MAIPAAQVHLRSHAKIIRFCTWDCRPCIYAVFGIFLCFYSNKVYSGRILLENSRGKYSFSFVNSNVGIIVYNMFSCIRLRKSKRSIRQRIDSFLMLRFTVYPFIANLMHRDILEISIDIRNRVKTRNINSHS